MKTLKGTPTSAGIAEGKVRIVRGIEDIQHFEDGDVLVSEMTEPSMVIMMNMAVAIVTDRGSVTSHPSIVSRELGIPCVVNTKTGTTDLKNGMRVRVDGGKGEVTILKI